MINNIYTAIYKASLISNQKEIDGYEKLIPTFLKTGIDIYPHQIVASMHALQDPYSRGFILCDEVGLGKGIEAMLVISQLFYMGQKIIVVVPSPLLEQWKLLIEERFDLKINLHNNNSAEENQIVLTTYNYICDNQSLFESDWDMVVFEEAHRLRGFYKEETKQSKILNTIFANTRKLLLTATPIQKNVMDLYGLITFIDRDLFGDPEDFYKMYYKKPENYAQLREIIAPYVFRTLRSQVKTDVKLPERNILTYEYNLNDPREVQLNKLLTDYITKPNKVAFPEMDTYELNLMFQKLFSSSFYALSKTLVNVYVRLNKIGNEKALEESKDIKEMLDIATGLNETSKSKIFLETIKAGFKQLKEKGFNKKIVVFTENTQTQEYLHKLLMQKTDYKTVVYNGSTTEKPLDEFKNKANILITTDLAGEGFNFDFCNMVVNYDNPWNILSLEQRIGRLHRIGQKADVSVVYFLCREIFSDVRFYELAFKRMNMFDGIMGATDNVVGDISCGKVSDNIASLFELTRTREEVDEDFNMIFDEFKENKQNRKEITDNFLFSTFDEKISKKTKNYVSLIKNKIEKLKNDIWEFSKYSLKGFANLDDDNKTINFTRSLFKSGNYNLSTYYLNPNSQTSKTQKWTFGRTEFSQMLSMNHIDQIPDKFGDITFAGDSKIKGMSGKMGYFTTMFFINGQANSINLFFGVDINGNIIDSNTCEDIFNSQIVSCKESTRSRRGDGLNASEYSNADWCMEEYKEVEDFKNFFKKNEESVLKDYKLKLLDSANFEISRLKHIYDKKKIALRRNIELSEKELKTIKNDLRQDNFQSEFVINQKVSDLTKQLNKQKENEFMERMKLNNEEKSKTDKMLAEAKAYVSISTQFLIKFKVI